jgi:hypothetical protein
MRRDGTVWPCSYGDWPVGEYSELYLSKTALPSWKQGQGDYDEIGVREFDLLAVPLAVVGFLWSSILFPLLRFTALLPFNIVRGGRSQAIRIEAVTTFPNREVLLWTTTDDQAQSVLEQIVAGLAQGKVLQPTDAVYSGLQGG